MTPNENLSQATPFPTSNGVDHPSLVAGAAKIHQVVDRLAEAARPAVDRLAAGTHQTLDRLTDVAASAAQTLKQKQKTLLETQARLSDSTRSYVTQKPLTSVGLALAGGILLSLLFSRK